MRISNVNDYIITAYNRELQQQKEIVKDSFEKKIFLEELKSVGFTDAIFTIYCIANNIEIAEDKNGDEYILIDNATFHKLRERNLDDL